MMKRLVSLLLSAVMLLSCVPALAESAGDDGVMREGLTALEVSRLMGNGTNLGNTMEACNTGAIARGYRDIAYPAPEILSYIAKKGGKVLLTSDAHSPEHLCYRFDMAEKYARDAGILPENILYSPIK